MRLLRTDTENGIRLESFDDPSRIPPYAILSHRWRDNEVLYMDILAQGPKEGERYAKIKGVCAVALKDGYNYVWIDTCCIDQKSSAELSESINSMFMWYRESATCYAYLYDVFETHGVESENSAFRKSEWFNRGWTLQELIAPRNVIFLTKDWEIIGCKHDLAGPIEDITRIEYGIICCLVPLGDICVAKKMSWAANRQTTKVEDRAYSLLGIFGINMTTIYGEGKNAFIRLQHEIMNQSIDHSIFAWDSRPTHGNNDPNAQCGLLAPSPDQFANSASIVSTPYSLFSHEWDIKSFAAEFQKTNAGIRIELPLFSAPQQRRYVAAIACKAADPSGSSTDRHTVGVILVEYADGRYARLRSATLVNADSLANQGVEPKVQRLYADDDTRASTYGDKITTVSKMELGAYTPREFEILANARSMKLFRDQYGYTFVENDSSVDPPASITLRNSTSSSGEDDMLVWGPYPTGLRSLDVKLQFVNSSSQDVLLLWLIVSLDDSYPSIGTCNLRRGQGFIQGRLSATDMSGNVRYHTVGFEDKLILDVILTQTGFTQEKAKYSLQFKLRSKSLKFQVL